ncbi:MAG: helix-turn-helix transcriptional regulator [Candidatus Aenigmarchaeota archaeon]|nr:helix-turn-helix transcriptional regulator [Candidatus Aenigmarchaeota archaeon]
MVTRKGVLNLISKKYSYNMLKTLEKSPKRFGELSEVCEGEKMRSQRLREFEEFDLLNIKVKRIGRRAISLYALSEKGKETLRLAEDINRLHEKKNS